MGSVRPVMPRFISSAALSLTDSNTQRPSRQISNCSLLTLLFRAFFAWAYDSYNDSLIISGGSVGNKAIRSSDSGETFHSLADVPVASQAACGVMVDNNTYLHIGGSTGGAE